MNMKFTLHSICVCDEKDARLSLINEEVQYKEGMDSGYLYFPNREIQLQVEKCSVSEPRTNLTFDSKTDSFFFSISSIDAVYTIKGELS